MGTGDPMRIGGGVLAGTTVDRDAALGDGDGDGDGTTPGVAITGEVGGGPIRIGSDGAVSHPNTMVATPAPAIRSGLLFVRRFMHAAYRGRP